MQIESLEKRLKETEVILSSVGFSEIVTPTAVVAIQLASRRVMRHYKKYLLTENLEVTRYGGSPQTEADLASRNISSKIIRQQFPLHEIIDEEAEIESGIAYQWFKDPLDGTITFVRKQPYFCLGEIVYHNEQPHTAVICNPTTRYLIVAEQGRGAYGFILNGRLQLTSDHHKLRVSQANTFVGASVYLDGAYRSERDNAKEKFFQELRKLADNNLNRRSTGSNLEQQLNVARGSAELSLTDYVSGFWDLAGSLLVKEAEGESTDERGNPVNQYTKIALMTNGYLHEITLRVLQENYPV